MVLNFYRCGLCGKVLVRRRDLERHLKSRHMSDMHPGSNIIEDSKNVVTHTSEDETEKLNSLDSWFIYTKQSDVIHMYVYKMFNSN